MTKGKKREVPKKNYIYLGLLSVATIAILCCFVKWYHVREQEQVISTVNISLATPIHVDELDNYLLENPDVLIYIANSSDETLVTFENTFDSYLRHKELNGKMVYINTANLTENEYQKLGEKYFNENRVVTPNLILISDGKKKEQLYNVQTEIKLTDVHQFLTKYGVIE